MARQARHIISIPYHSRLESRRIDYQVPFTTAYSAYSACKTRPASLALFYARFAFRVELHVVAGEKNRGRCTT